MSSHPPVATHSEVEAAEVLGITPKWLANEARANRVPFVRLGRYRRYTDDHINQIISERTRTPEDTLGRSARSRKGRAA